MDEAREPLFKEANAEVEKHVAQANQLIRHLWPLLAGRESAAAGAASSSDAGIEGQEGPDVGAGIGGQLPPPKR
eukprot:320410-Prymnesium_polylepis.1